MHVDDVTENFEFINIIFLLLLLALYSHLLTHNAYYIQMVEYFHEMFLFDAYKMNNGCIFFCSVFFTHSMLKTFIHFTQ